MKAKVKKAKTLIKSGSTVKDACAAAGLSQSNFYYHGGKAATLKDPKTRKTRKTRSPNLLTLSVEDKKPDQVFIFIGPAHLAQETLSQYRSNNNG